MNQSRYWKVLVVAVFIAIACVSCKRSVVLDQQDLDTLSGKILDGLNARVVTNPNVNVSLYIPPNVSVETEQMPVDEITLQWAVKQFEYDAENVTTVPINCDAVNDCQPPNCWLLPIESVQPDSYSLQEMTLISIGENEDPTYPTLEIVEENGVLYAYQDFETIGGNETVYTRVAVVLSKTDGCTSNCSTVRVDNYYELTPSDEGEHGLTEIDIMTDAFNHCTESSGETSVCVIEISGVFSKTIGDETYRWTKATQYFSSVERLRAYVEGLQGSTLTMERIQPEP